MLLQAYLLFGDYPKQREMNFSHALGAAFIVFAGVAHRFLA